MKMFKEMSYEFVLMSMIFFHIVDDYYLQGILASMKQKEWWKKNAPKELYENDYIIALIVHGFSWAFMIHLPIAILFDFSVGRWFVISIVFNATLHAIIDDIKANDKTINLIKDQLLHIGQILLVYCYCTCL